MTVLLIALVLIVAALVVVMTMPLPAERRSTYVASPPRLYGPSTSHGVLKGVFVPEDEIRSYMATHKKVVHSSAPAPGGYIVNVAALNKVA